MNAGRRNDSRPSNEPSVKDVAARAGVSTATVSRVLAGKATVGAERTARVEVAVAALGYRGNRAARRLRTQTSEVIGVVIPDVENPHYTEMVREMESAAFAADDSMLLSNTDEDPAKQATYLGVLEAEMPAGVILAPSDPSGREIGRLLDRGVPIVAVDRPVTDERAHCIVVDNEAGARRATELLIDLGHRRIGFVGGPSGIPSADQRLGGYAAATAGLGLNRIVCDGGFRIDPARVAVGQLLDSAEPPTALLVANNLMTIGALEAIAERTLAIPGEVSVIAFDDPFWTEIVNPALSAVRQPVREIAQRAIELLLRDVRSGLSTAERTVLPVDLVVRRSSGPFRGAMTSEARHET